MKIAIKGHPFRGKEVIQILESLGGKNKWFHYGNNENCFYELHDDCIWCATTRSEYFKYYTLEEFEKEFPFKVGDKVVWDKDNYTTVRTVLRIDYSDLAGIKYAITAFGEANCFWEVDVNELKSYKEMKEERNITLTLDKAKEWYKKGGELREIALQAFNEKELTKVVLPKTWEEFCENYPVQKGECWLSDADDILQCSYSQHRINKNWIPSKKSAEAHLAMIQLEQLRDCWRQGWKPNWLEGNVQKYVIQKWRDKISIETPYITHSFLSFPTYEMAKEFLACFRDLIEKAGDLI